MKAVKRMLGLIVIATFAAAGLAAADSIEGVVTLKGKAPAGSKINLGGDKKCQAARKNKDLMTEDYVTNGDKLQYVLVSVKDAKKGGTKPPKALIDQAGCHYEPHVFGLMVGQDLEVRSSDPFMHNINATGCKANPGFNLSQPNKGSETKHFDKPEPAPFKIKCNVHKWMSSWCQVFDHPYFAVTDKDGKFKINGISAGKYTLVFWHEKAGSKEMKIEVKGTAKANMTLDAK